MGKGFLKNLLLFAVIIIIAIVLFRAGTIYGFVFLLAVIIFLLFIRRTVIYSFLGRTSYFNGDIEKAIAWYKKAYKTEKAKPPTVASYAYLLLKSGNLSEAETILDRLLRSRLSKDERLMAKSNMALVQWKKGDLDEAIETLEEVIESYETSNIYGSLGYMLIQKGDLEKALEFNLKAYEYNSENAVIQDNLGQTYYLMRDYDKATDIYEKLMEKEPSFPEAYYNYALLLKAKGENEKALQTVKKALNYKLTFLSTIQKEDIDKLINELESNNEQTEKLQE